MELTKPRVMAVGGPASLTIIELIRELMEHNGMTQDDLARVTGSHVLVAGVHSGKSAISKRFAKALGKAFDTDPTLFIV